jgi:hypothetical protein
VSDNKYLYFEKDGAYFRKKKSSEYMGVDEVLHPTGWVPYKGDRLAPVYYGDKLTKQEIEKAGLERHEAA